jgi:hypothetical protein
VVRAQHQSTNPEKLLRKQKQVSMQIQLFPRQNLTPPVPANMNRKLVPLLVKLLRGAGTGKTTQRSGRPA